MFCMVHLALSYYHRYEASEIWKLSRKHPADFQELPLSAVTRLVVFFLASTWNFFLDAYGQGQDAIVVFGEISGLLTSPNY